MITRQSAANTLMDYLSHRIGLNELVQWAEWAMMEEEFEAGYEDLIRDIVGRLGLSDVAAFGLTWENCETFLATLGYEVHLEFSAVGSVKR